MLRDPSVSAFSGSSSVLPNQLMKERTDIPFPIRRGKFGLQFLPDVITSVDSGITRVANVCDTFEISLMLLCSDDAL